MSTVRRIEPVKEIEPSHCGQLFLQYQAARGLAARTITVQRNIVNILLENAPKDIGDVTAWQRVITKLITGKNEAYYNKILTTARRFFDFLRISAGHIFF